MNVYGDILTGTTARDAVMNTLKIWMPAYLAEVGEQSGRTRTDLPDIRSYTTSLNRLNKFKATQLPACCLVVPGIMSKPQRGGDGAWRATWAVGVGFYVTGTTKEDIEDNVQLYCAAARSAILQHRSLGGVAMSTEWIDEQYDSISFNRARSVQAGVVSLGVEIASVVNSSAGPTEPPDDPAQVPQDWGTVQKVFLSTEGQSS